MVVVVFLANTRRTWHAARWQVSSDSNELAARGACIPAVGTAELDWMIGKAIGVEGTLWKDEEKQTWFIFEATPLHPNKAPGH